MKNIFHSFKTDYVYNLQEFVIHSRYYVAINTWLKPFIL